MATLKGVKRITDASNDKFKVNGNNTELYAVDDIVLFSGSTEIARIKGSSSTLNLLQLTASRPLKLNGSKDIVSTQIDLSSSNDVSNTLGTTNGGTGLSSLGTANQVLGVNAGATGLEYKTLVAGTSGTDFIVNYSANTITFNIPDASGTNRGLVTTSSQTFGGTKTFSSISITSSITLTSGTGAVLTDTTDGSDTKQITLGGGGALDATRGAVLTLKGNEQATNGGAAILQCGNIAGSFVELLTVGTQPIIFAVNNAEVSRFDTSTFRTNLPILFNLTNGDIYQNTSDGTDNRRVRIGGGGDTDASRGAYVECDGNEHSGTGKLLLNAGNVSGGSVDVFTGNTQRWSFNGSQLIYYASTTSLVSNTSDGSDSFLLNLCGGGAASASRGAQINLSGNENASAGDIELLTGNGSSGLIRFYTGAAVQRWTIDASGHLKPFADNTYDFGTTSLHIANAYFNNIFNDISSNALDLTSRNSGGINFNASTTGSTVTRWSMSAGSNELVYVATAGTIRGDTSDGSDTAELNLTGGGAAADGRGGTIGLYGEQHASLPGQVRITAVGSSGYVVVRTSATERIRIDENGYFLVGVTSPVSSAHTIKKAVGEGNNVLVVQGNTNDAIQFFSVANTAYNSNAAGIRVGKDSTSNRSINGAGTINANGADYAEYMYKNQTCGTLEKGAIVGIDSEGLLTDKWSEAKSFAIKSTAPAYVGGDNWGTLETLEDKNLTLEEAREQVDRIAFSGRVPVNVSTSWNVGDYILAEEGDNDTIVASVKAVNDVSLTDLLNYVVGKVWAEDEETLKPIVAVIVN